MFERFSSHCSDGGYSPTGGGEYPEISGDSLGALDRRSILIDTPYDMALEDNPANLIALREITHFPILFKPNSGPPVRCEGNQRQ